MSETAWEQYAKSEGLVWDMPNSSERRAFMAGHALELAATREALADVIHDRIDLAVGFPPISSAPFHARQDDTCWSAADALLAPGGAIQLVNDVLAAAWDEGAQYVLDMYDFEPYRKKNPYRFPETR